MGSGTVIGKGHAHRFEIGPAQFLTEQNMHQPGIIGTAKKELTQTLIFIQK